MSTELHQIELQQKIKQSHDLVDLLINSGPLILFSVDNDGMVTRLEGKGLEALWITPGQFVG